MKLEIVFGDDDSPLIDIRLTDAMVVTMLLEPLIAVLIEIDVTIETDVLVGIDVLIEVDITLETAALADIDMLGGADMLSEADVPVESDVLLGLDVLVETDVLGDIGTLESIDVLVDDAGPVGNEVLIGIDVLTDSKVLVEIEILTVVPVMGLDTLVTPVDCPVAVIAEFDCTTLVETIPSRQEQPEDSLVGSGVGVAVPVHPFNHEGKATCVDKYDAQNVLAEVE